MTPIGESAATSDALLRFWFADATSSPDAARAVSKRWFTSDVAFDATIARDFGALPERALRGELDAWMHSPRMALARTIALDQFPRNLYRGDPRSFRYDECAQRSAERALASGFDQQVTALEAVFFYLPFEHAEDIGQQDRSVALFGALRARAPDGLSDLFAGFFDYAHRHREVIARFGRFPHRNEMLGRTATALEEDWLQQGGERFGAAQPR